MQIGSDFRGVKCNFNGQESLGKDLRITYNNDDEPLFEAFIYL